MKLTINETAQELREEASNLIDTESMIHYKPRSKCSQLCDCLTIGKYRTPLPLSKNQQYYSSPCACLFSCIFFVILGLFAALSVIEIFTSQSNWLFQVYNKPISYYQNNQTVCDSYFGCEDMTVENLMDMIVSRREYYIAMNAVIISFSRC